MVQFKFQDVRELIFHGKTFCCCLPVRIGVLVLSLLGVLFAGLLSIVLWFEVANGQSLTSGERAGFAVIALVETFLLVACLLGFIGVVVRKQLFVQIYAYFLYFHLLLNIAAAIFLLVEVTRFTNSAAYHLCLDTIRDDGAQKQCVGFLQTARWVYFAVSSVLLLIEMYVAIIVARYVNQIQREKRRARRAQEDEASYRMSVRPPKSARYSALQDNEALLSPGQGFGQPRSPGVRADPNYTSVGDDIEYYNPYEEADVGYRSMPSEEEGYGGGSWTHQSLSHKEKMALDDEPEDLQSHPPRQGDQPPQYSE